MNKNSEGKSTASKAAANKPKKKSSNADNGREKKEEIFREVTINLNNTDYNIKQKKKKKKKKKHKVVRTFLTALLIVFLVFTGIFLKRWNDNGWTLGGFVATILGHDSNTLANLPRVNILVVGQSQNLTDTILVCSYDPKVQEVSMLSIPRDTFVGTSKRSASGSDKINAIYQRNPDLLLKKVNQITGMNINYYIKVDTKGLRELVDSIGGIYFDVPMDMDYDDVSQDLHIHLKAGYQLLDGDKAEQVVRFRHNNDGSSYDKDYGDQDLGRMRTQRAFITETIKQLAKAENITKVDQYIRIANEHLSTNFNLWTLKDYAPYLIDYKTENMKTATLPGAPEKINELWFYSCNVKQTREVVKELFSTELTKEQEKNAEIKIAILNGSGDDTKLENLKNLLKENGYTISSTGETTKTKKTSIINRTNQEESTMEKLKELIGVGITSSSTPSKNGVDFTIIIGEDY